MADAELSLAHTFLWGSLGGLLAYFLVFALPFFRQLGALGGAQLEVTWLNIVGALGVLVIYVVSAGVVAILIGGATEAKHAITAGIAWESTLGGLLKPGAGGRSGS